MIATTAQLLEELQARGLVAADAAAAPPAESHDRPWYVGLMLGIAGWLAGIFLTIFAFLLFKPGSSGGAWFAGAGLLVAAWGLFRVDRDGAFVSQLALALSIAGQIAVLVSAMESVFKDVHGLAGPALAAFVLQLAMIAAMPNRLHRAMSALFACAAWAVFLRYAMFDKGDSLFPRDAGVPFGQALMAWVITWLPVGGGLHWIIRNEASWMARGYAQLVRPAALGIILGLAVATLLSTPVETFRIFGPSPAPIGWFALWPLLSALAALGALVAAFALGYRGIAAVCIVAALLHLSHFYYAMGTSLLVKSLVMIVLGAALLFAARGFSRRAP